MFIFGASTLILAAKMETLELFLDSVEFDDAIPLEVERECAAKRYSGRSSRGTDDDDLDRVRSGEQDRR
jgi:hypothetical protein